MIALNGPSGLSLRSVARYCGMSAPGVLHHFDGLKPLLEQVLAQRDAEEYASAAASLIELGDDASVLDLGDAFVHHIAAKPIESRNFDALEAEAVASVAHPAHEYYSKQLTAPHPMTVALAARHYSQPEVVVTILMVLVDGMRHRWQRAEGIPDYIGDWQQLRPSVEARFEYLRLPH